MQTVSGFNFTILNSLISLYKVGGRKPKSIVTTMIEVFATDEQILPSTVEKKQNGYAKSFSLFLRF